MRQAEIKHAYRIPDSHPYISVVSIDPADHRRVCRMIDDRPELRALYTDTKRADRWTMHIGCASRRVRSDLEHWIDNVL